MMTFYSKHHIIRYSIASGMDGSIPRNSFLDKTTISTTIKTKRQHPPLPNNNIENGDDVDNGDGIPTYYSNTSIVDNKSQGLTLPTRLDGQFVNNGQSILSINTDDSKTFTLHAINAKGQCKKIREFSLNTYYDQMLFSADQSFCLLLEDVKDRSMLRRKLYISYIYFKKTDSGDGTSDGHYQQQQSLPQPQVQRNVLEVTFNNSSFSLINQHKYQLSPQGKFLAIVHFTNTRKILSLIRIDRKEQQQNNGTDDSFLRLTNTTQIDLSDHFLWNYLKEIKFNSTEDKVLLVSSRTVKQDNVVVCSLRNGGHVHPLEFLHNTRKQDTVSYHFVNDYMHKDLMIRTSTCGQIEVKRLIGSGGGGGEGSYQRNIKHFNVKTLFNLSKQLTCFTTHASFKKLNLYTGTTSGEVFVIDVNKCTIRSKIVVGNESFRVSNLYVNWLGTEIFALKEVTGKKARANVRIAYVPNQKLLSLQEIAAKTVLENFPMSYIKGLGISKPLRYFLH